MSRSNQTDLISPAQKFYDWRGSEGILTYFDKTLGEKGENVPVDLPFRFLILDRLSQVTGGVDADAGYIGYWSNVIRNTKTQQLVVRSKRGIEVQGYYEAIKGYPGLRFMTGLYIAYYDEDKHLQIGYLKVKGAALTAWIEFTKAHRNLYEGAFGIVNKTKKKKGSNTYYEPVFEYVSNVSEESDAAAKDLDVHLQEYLTAYFAQNGIAELEYAGISNGTAFYENEPPMSDVNHNEPPDPDEWNNQF